MALILLTVHMVHVYILSSTANVTLFFFSSHILNWPVIGKPLCPTNIKMTRQSFCVVKSKVLVRMRVNMPQGTEMHFFVPRARDIDCFFFFFFFFKIMHTIRIFDGRPVSVTMTISKL